MFVFSRGQESDTVGTQVKRERVEELVDMLTLERRLQHCATGKPTVAEDECQGCDPAQLKSDCVYLGESNAKNHQSVFGMRWKGNL